jgi:ribonuclease P/MRP protein subunit POP7
VELRTRTVGTVDDVIIEDEDVEDSSRIRKLSCLEVIVRLR